MNYCNCYIVCIYVRLRIITIEMRIRTATILDCTEN